MLSSQYSNVFAGSNPASSVTLTPMVSAEWNQNLFNQPYITVAGNGIAESIGSATGTLTKSDNTTSSFMPATFTDSFNLNGNTFSMSENKAQVSYNFDTESKSPAYKIITYVLTDSDMPIQLNAYAKGSSTQFGSTSVDINSFDYIKVITYVGSSGPTDHINNLTYSLNFSTYNDFDVTTTPVNIYYTVPQVYETTFCDYQHESLWPTDSAFGFFRPGESYVASGNSSFSFPTNYRQITTQKINGVSTFNSPITSVTQNPSFTLVNQPSPLYKNVLPSDMAAYKYFVSESTENLANYNVVEPPMITGIYEPHVNANKIVIKLNVIQTTPTITVMLDGTAIATGVKPDSNGLLVLYYNGSDWSTNKWSVMPTFQTGSANVGQISPLTSFGRITIKQTAADINLSSDVYDLTNPNVADDLTRMQLVEVSPRIEVDLTSYIMDMDINKQLDAKNNYIPISSINPNEADITLSGIPLTYNNGTTSSPVPLFSSQNQGSVLFNMMRKNIKFYLGWNFHSYFLNGEQQASSYIPAGVYWSNSWDETDIQTVKVSCFDIVNYMQTVPAPDYVASNKSIFDILTNIFDIAGFTDYDYDSLYHVTKDAYTPMDMYYYFCNSQSSTLYDVLSELCLAHQLGAYIDEYGVMKFLSLTNIMRVQDPMVDFTDASVIQGGYSITNKTKPGAITVSYQEPKVTQSLALQNATNPSVQNSPSFIYTTSNEVVWTQKDADSVGSNYLSSSMLEKHNYFQMNNNSLLDIFHTYLLNNDGYAVIENEVVSFLYKEYLISQTSNPSINKLVYPKTDLELASYITDFIKENQVGLVPNSGAITNATPDGTHVVYACSNNFQVGQNVSVTGVTPSVFNVSGIITATDGITFTVRSTIKNTISYVSGGLAVVATGDNAYNITVTPTGKIANVQRGMFGTVASDHKIITSLNDKQLTAENCSVSIATESLSVSDNPVVAKIRVTPSGRARIFNGNAINPLGYQTYSCKFDLNGTNSTSGGVFFSTGGTQYSVNLVQVAKYNKVGTTITPVTPAAYNYYFTINKLVGGTETIVAFSEANGTVYDVQANWEKVLTKVKSSTSDAYTYAYGTDQEYNLKVVLTYSDGSDGEVPGTLIDAFLNNTKITGWQIPDASNNNSPLDDNLLPTVARMWKSPLINSVTGLAQKVNLDSSNDIFNGVFGFTTTVQPIMPSGITNPFTGSGVSAQLREIYACAKPLVERSVSYYYQDREFLNGMVQNQRLFTQYPSYMMQTNPEVTGINYYDVQYQTPAATSVDVLPIEYLWKYFPGTQPTDQQYYQSQMVDEYSLSYSTPINTGFRARLAIANNVGHMVYLTHASDSTNSFTVNLNLWTHEVVAPSDAQTLHRVLDRANQSEVIQVDSPWIQSKHTANRLIDVITIGNDGFSRDTSLQVFGNPLIQVGDIIRLTYGLAGISNAKYLVHGVSHTFKNGLKTTLTLNSLSKVENPANM